MIDLTPRLGSTYIGESKEGMSRPQLFLVDGEGLCLVKFFQSPQGLRVLINEFIGYSLASVLEVSCPPCGLVHIDADLFPPEGKLELPENDRHYACTFEAGLHFYSKYLATGVDKLVPNDLRTLHLQNASDFAGAVLLDLLLNNWDRKPGNMNVLLHRERGVQKLKVIDFGNAIGGGGWGIGSFQDTNLPPLIEPLPYPSDIEGYLRAVNPDRDFEPFLERLERLDETTLGAIIEAVPNEWQLTVEERTALLNYLSQRVQALPEYLRERRQKDVWWQ